MFCKQCGSELKNGAVFCTNCGAKLMEETAQAIPVGQDADLDKTVGVFGNVSVPGPSQTVPEQQVAPMAPDVQTQQAEYTVPIPQPSPVNQPVYRPNIATNAESNGFQQQASKQTTVTGSPSNGKVGFGEAVTLLFKNYANFRGRASKSEFWWGFLFLCLVNVVGYILSVVLPPLGGLITLGVFLPNLSLNIRRLHDIGKAWYSILMGLIPFAGIVILITYYCKDSDGDNQWGPGLPVNNQSTPVNIQNTRNTTSQPANNPPQPMVNAPVAPVASAQKIITDNDIVIMAQNHEPVNLNTPEAKFIMDSVISRIIPTYTGTGDLASAMMQCNPQDIKDRIVDLDTDTLLVIFKAIGYYIGIGADQNILGLVQQNVMSVLKTRF